MAVDRLKIERRELRELSPSGVIKVGPSSPDNIFVWEAIVTGPPNTVWGKGQYKLILTFTDDYPFYRPSARFETPIFHPNVSRFGNVCINILHDWRPSITIAQILNNIIYLLSHPNARDPYNGEAGQLYLTDPKAYDRKVEEYAANSANPSSSSSGAVSSSSGAASSSITFEISDAEKLTLASIIKAEMTDKGVRRTALIGLNGSLWCQNALEFGDGETASLSSLFLNIENVRGTFITVGGTSYFVTSASTNEIDARVGVSVVFLRKTTRAFLMSLYDGSSLDIGSTLIKTKKMAEYIKNQGY